MMSHNTVWGMVHLLALAAGLWTILGNTRLLAFASPMHRSVALSTVMGAFLFWVSVPHPPFEDFVDAYYAAGVAVLHGGPHGLLPEIELGVGGFVNLPVVAYLFVPFALLPGTSASILFTIIGVAAVVWSWRLLVRLAELGERQAAALLFLFAANGPLCNSVKEGNTSHFILLLFVLALTWIRDRRGFMAGVALGVAAVIKPPLVLVGAYFVVRRRWGVVAGGATSILAAAGLSLVLFGLEFHKRWYELCVKPFSRDPMAAFNVQSIQGFWLRFQLGIDGLFNWQPVPFAAPFTWLSGATVAGVVLLAGLALLWPAVRKTTGVRCAGLLAVEFVVVISMICAISPVSWSHYYAWYLVPFALFLAQQEPEWRHRFIRQAGWLGIALLSVPVISVNYAPGWLRMPYMQIVTSGLLLGGLLYFLILLWVRNRMAVRISRN